VLYAAAVAGEFGAITPKAPKPINEVKAEKAKQLSTALDNALETLTVTVANKTYNANRRMRERVSSTVARNSRGKPVKGTLLDATGEVVSVNVAQLQDVEDEMVAAAEALEDNYATKIAAVKAAQTVEAVNAVGW
jgi:hypothetical protein